MGLRDSQLRKSLEKTEGIFIAEGEKIIRRALAARCRPRSFLVQARWLESLSEVWAEHDDVPAVTVQDYQPAERLALLVGTEGNGLSDDWIARADVCVRIPMAPGVDSLNVATAAAILGWTLRDTTH